MRAALGADVSLPPTDRLPQRPPPAPLAEPPRSARAEPEEADERRALDRDTHQAGMGGALLQSLLASPAPPSSAPFSSAPHEGELTPETSGLLHHFGLDPEHVPPAARGQLNQAFETLRVAGLAIAAGRTDGHLPGPGAELRFEQGETAEGLALRLELTTDETAIHLQASLSADGSLTTRLTLESSAAFRLEGERSTTLLAVPVTGGVVLLADGLGVERKGRAVAEPSDDEALAGLDDLTDTSSEEGVGAFFRGALLGDFAGDDSWSAIAGQTAVGFVPVVGQIADIRDLIAASRAVHRGDPGASVGLGAAVIGFVPGLDFLKGGARASRKVLKEAAENLGEVTEAGLKHAGKKLNKEAVARAKRELKALAAGRVELIARLDQALMDPSLNQEVYANLLKARNALQHGFKPADLVGAVRDKLGVPVKKDTAGNIYDHIKEVMNTLDSLRKAEETLVTHIPHMLRRAQDPAQFSKLAGALRELAARGKSFLEIAR